MTPRTKAKTSKRRTSNKHALPPHPCDRPDVRACIFALSALYRAGNDELTMPDYLMHRRELTIRLGDTLSPSKGSRFGSSFPTARLDVRLRRELCDQLKALASSYPGDLDDLVDQALDAGLQKIVPRLRRHFTKKKS